MVATPMRLVSVLREGALDLSSVEVRCHYQHTTQKEAPKTEEEGVY